MNKPDASPDRLHAMEERITFQQKAIDDMHEVVLRQQRQLEAVERELVRLTAAMGRLSELSQGDLPHEKPPHY
jgi:uncharacterized coiled-coil protein SlyX